MYVELNPPGPKVGSQAHDTGFLLIEGAKFGVYIRLLSNTISSKLWAALFKSELKSLDVTNMPLRKIKTSTRVFLQQHHILMKFLIF